MESGSAWDLNLLLRSLAQGEEQTRQLEANMEDASPAEHCKPLAQKIRSTLEEAISMAKLIDSRVSRQPACPNNTAASDAPRSKKSGSPKSEISERVFKEHERRQMSKKRKILPKQMRQVRVSDSGAIEGLEDGYDWRKYGRKEILGARHPRDYYRCIHRNRVGCLATKQVQKSDEDPCVFEITYRGEHTCPQRRQTAPISAPKKQDLQQDMSSPPVNDEAQHPHQDQQLPSRTTLEAKTQGLDMHEQSSTSSFSFPLTPLSSFGSENQIIFSSATSLENNYMSSSSPPFISPTTSDLNYYSISPWRMSSYGGELAPNTSESDLTETISIATSTINPPKLDTSFMLHEMEFDPIFPFDDSNFF